MTSLLGGNFSEVIHTALTSHLNGLSQKTSDSEAATTFSSSSSSDSPPYDPITSLTGVGDQTGGLTLDLFKDGLFQFAALGHPPPTDVANSDTASSESPEPSAQNEHDDLAHATEEQHSAALSLIQSFGQPKLDVPDAFGDISEATIRDLMPVLAAAQGSAVPSLPSANSTVTTTGNTSSPSAWARNAGRKKSHPVWDFFRDMKDTTGSGGVVCLHCSWSGDDRSPNNLRTHLKKFHSDDGIFGLFSEKLAKTPTQPYVKRVRGGGSSASSQNQNLQSMVKMEQKPMLDSMAFLQQLQQSGSLPETDFSSFGAQTLNFLDSLPKSSEVININSGHIKNEEPEEDAENHVEAASSSSSDEPIRNVDSPEGRTSSPRSTADHQSDQLAAFVSSLTSTNPMMFAMLNAAGNSSSSNSHSHSQPLPPATLPPVPPNLAAAAAASAAKEAANRSASPSKLDKDPSSFSLSEGPCATQLMSMALDLEMTMSYHRRRIDVELCFESNRTAEKSGGRGKVICLTDLGKEIKITERVNGAVCDTELWTKTDFNQFHWAIRGKCQKCFNKQ